MTLTLLAALLASNALAVHPPVAAFDDDYGGYDDDGWFPSGTSWPVSQPSDVPPVPAPKGVQGGVLQDDSPRILRRLDGHLAPVRSAVFSPDGKLVLTASWDGTASLWDAGTGEKKWSSGEPSRSRDQGLQTAVFSPDGKVIAAGGEDKVVRLWDAASGALRATLTGHTAQIDVVAFSGDGAKIITGSRDGTARIWDAASGAELRNLVADGGDVSAAALDSDGGRALIGTTQGSAKLWSFRDARAVTLAVESPPSFGAKSVGFLAFLSGGSKVLLAQRGLRVLDAASGALERSFADGEGLGTVSIDAAERHVAAVDSRSHLRVFDLAGGKLTRDVGPLKSNYGAALSPDGSRVVLAESLWAVIWRIDYLPEEREAVRRALDQTVEVPAPGNGPGSASNRFRRNFGK